ncbi:HEPN domain-containing protein [Myxococcus xanthus]|uniref:HEPN domain-containing protein n=1 Tax=Myxococcus xanthus TaxID=34 RepID=UPI001129C4C2|nr:HEPN domain-containing protein [Myxococcus xanthus]
MESNEKRGSQEGTKYNVLDEHYGRKERAAARLAASPDKRICFALLGFKTAVQEFAFLPSARLQEVEDPPTVFHLAGALERPDLLHAVGRYTDHLRYELAVDANHGPTGQAAFTLASQIVAALRAKSLAEFLVPAVADYSWSTIAAAPERGCKIQLIEDVPQARRIAEPIEVQRADLEWVSTHLTSFSSLLEDARFNLAVEALSTHQHHPTPRMMTAVLWSGIEALFKIEHELSFRIACYTAAVLAPRGRERRDLYEKVKAFYAIRSKAVHGSKAKDDDLLKHVVEVRQVLSRLICTFTEAKRLPSSSELDDALFT